MESIWNKFSYDRAAVIEDAFSIATNRGQLEWSDADKDVMHQAADTIVFSLRGDEGLTFVEFEILAAYAARLDPTNQLAFLDNLAAIIRASRVGESLSEYDERFLNFVVGIHNGLAVAGEANLGLYVPPGLADANIAQHVLGQAPAPVDLIQIPSGETTRTWKSEFEEVSGAGKYTTSVVETVTGDAFMSGGTYSTTSTTSSSFTPSITPMLGIREASGDIRQSIEDSPASTAGTGFGHRRGIREASVDIQQPVENSPTLTSGTGFGIRRAPVDIQQRAGDSPFTSGTGFGIRRAPVDIQQSVEDSPVLTPGSGFG